MRYKQPKSLWTTSLKWLQAGLLVGVILLIGSIAFFNHGQGEESHQIDRLKSDNASLKSNITNKKRMMDMQMQQEALNNSNPIIKKSSRQLAAGTQAEQKANELFPILINYSSAKTYLARSSKASKYVARHILQDKQIFDNNKSAADYIDYAGLHSQLKDIDFSAGNISGNNLPVIIKVNYFSWFTNKRRSDNQDLYLGTYNYATGRFSQLYRFGNLYEGAGNDD
ncbi:hypothetical protein [Lactobacillus crispatus]|jgi:hypothetical protein|uniref:Uncharacterized protein n=1 Tax=Lactobacillus crispatus TaxID=47770 RepID=A0AAW8WLQ0_9LACO|nr:hypothetical protein [Lactobacillus crispatus]STX18397.1 Uncharacterised protein [Lactobacillus acidophilus]MCT7696526.1 hypothetical protein [Lactobacillus crispatus]MCT7707988.1 hypothetical protein [Lactobacillus crispatus]MCT7731601.1 hypothetical protein [Lactobacillus crispatus]MCT7802464.1 hypothetical protein [Lactobacillus crispatus]